MKVSRRGFPKLASDEHKERPPVRTSEVQPPLFSGNSSTPIGLSVAKGIPVFQLLDMISDKIAARTAQRFPRGSIKKARGAAKNAGRLEIFADTTSAQPVGKRCREESDYTMCGLSQS